MPTCRISLPPAALVAWGALFFQVTLVPASAQVETDVLAYHGGTVASLGVNSTEQGITPGSVNVAAFGKQFATSITDIPDLTGIPSSTLPIGTAYSAPAGQVYAEPLVKTGVNITTGSLQGVHDVVFVATSMDSLYAIDANGGSVLWKDSFIYNASGNPNPLNPTLPAGVTAVPGGFGTETNSQDLKPWIGIVATPVIDGTNGYIYLTAKTREVQGGDQGHPHYVYTLHKVRLADGFDTNVVIADTTLQTSDTTYTYNSGPYVLGMGDGATTVGGQSRIYFNSVRQMIRPALELYKGRVYIASASHGDNQPYHGWVLTYDASTLACNGAWNATPNGSEGEGGVWQGGGGVLIDSNDPNGYIYFETGNGNFDGTNTGGSLTGLDANGFPNAGNYSDCFVKLVLDPTTSQGNQGGNLNGWGLKVVDYFSPYNNHTLDGADTDLGSGGPTLLPDSAGSLAHPKLLVGGGKEGKLYLIDRDNMGKYGFTDNIVQTFGGAVNGLLSVPGYFAGRLYATSGYGGKTSSWPLINGAITTGSGQSSNDNINFPGCSPYISANGQNNGVVWVIDFGTGQLRAYDATNLTTELWTSNQNATRDSLGSAVKFSCPTPANGHVYVGTADHLVAYGPPIPPASPPAAPTGLSAVASGPSTILLLWTDNSNNEDNFRIERSSDNVNFTEIAVVGVNQNTYGDSGLSSQATYYYRVRASNSYNTLSYSAYTNVASATTLSTGAEQPADLYHFDEGAGTSTIDSVGGNNGTLIGTPSPTWISPGHIGSSNLSFSGDGQDLSNGESAVQVSHDLSPILGQTSSLLFWIKTTQTGNDTHYMAPAVTGVEEAAGTNDINWGYINSKGQIGVAVGDSGSVMSVNPINDGNWHHIALTRDAILGTVNVYVDGILSSSSGSSSSLDRGAKSTPFYLIGALSDVAQDQVTFQGANYFNGQLDDVQVYGIVVDATFIAGVALAPAAPTNLVVTPASGTELDLSWNDNASNETGYEVWSSVNGGAYLRIAQLPANTVSYVSGSLTQGTPYSYFVRAVNSVGSSDSNIVNSATPVPPPTPTGALVTYLAPTEVDLQWTDNATNETGYKVLRRTDNADFAQVASLPPNTTSYQDRAVIAGISYDYHIQAYNIAGYSDFTGLSITTPSQPQIQSYLAGFGLTGADLTNPAADTDHDGVPNLLEYAFNRNPLVPSPSGMPQVGEQNGYMTISFVQRIPPTDLIYNVQVSGDLVNWTSGTTLLSVTPIDAATQLVTVRDNIAIDPSSGAPRFIRVQVTH